MASLLVSIFMGWLPIAGALLAIGLGIGAVRSINGSGGTIKGKGIAVAGLVLGTLGLLFWIAVFVIAAVADPVPVDPVADSDRPDSSDLELAGVAQPGDCFDFELDGGEYTNDADDTVSCSVPHSAEYAGALILPNPAGEVYPGDDETFLAGLDGCADVYVDHVGEEIGLRPELDIFVAYPSELSWRILDDREVFCYVINADETDLVGPVTS